MITHIQIAIIGSGPGGLSAAARAAKRNVTHVLLESSSHLANTIQHYQKGKFVMAEPSRIPLRSDLSFKAGRREDILEVWRNEAVNVGVNIRYNAEVVLITKNEDSKFEIVLSNGDQISADNVVLAIGLQGNLRKLAVPGDDLPEVQYQLDDPSEYLHETIVVIGAGDAGVENALALAEQNEVILLNRQEEFNCKPANLSQLNAAASAGKIQIRLNTAADHIEKCTDGQYSLNFVVHDANGIFAIKCHRVIARLGATPPRKLLEKFGIQFPSDVPETLPQLNDCFESNVLGMYVIGALAGYPLIKQAMNQGYDVVEQILGYEIEPVDNELLREKLIHIPQAISVAAGIDWIRNIIPLFATMSNLQLRELLHESTIRSYAAGEYIYKLNDYGNSLFSILDGEIFLQTEDKEGGIGRFDLVEGDIFGEMELISGRPRCGVARAVTPCVVIESPRRPILKLLKTISLLKQAFDKISLPRAIKIYLDADLPSSELSYLLGDAIYKTYQPGEVLLSEGEPSEGLYLILCGSVTESHYVSNSRILKGYLASGNYIGEMALLANGMSNATFTAASRTEILLLKTDRVRSVLQRNESIRNKIDTLSLENISRVASSTNNEYGDLLNFIFEQGGGEATNMLLLDNSLCIRCNICEESCADEHGGISRLSREVGPSFQDIHIPVSCRHCEHPHCAKDCPPDAIHRLISGEVVIDERCIGCGNCQRNCPYGAIKMEVAHPYRKNSFWNLLFGKKSPATLVESKMELAKKAIKCDQCFDLVGGPACVSKCPTGAAKRVDPEELLNFGVNCR